MLGQKLFEEGKKYAEGFNFGPNEDSVKKLDDKLLEYQHRLEEVEAALISTREEFEKPFSKEKELQSLLQRQEELNSILLEESKNESEKNTVETVNVRRKIAL